ncbi:MAG: hypothetical protein HY318_12435 [Armatimonadetes bacterium]|nr:hypothetical protein [Armatimonadota bacterium]
MAQGITRTVGWGTSLGVVVLLVALSGSLASAPAEETPQYITVFFKVVELDVKTGTAKALSEPSVMTMDGIPASIQTKTDAKEGCDLNVDVTVRIVDSNKLSVDAEVRMTTRKQQGVSQRLAKTSLLLRDGEPLIMSSVASHSKSGETVTDQTTMILIGAARACGGKTGTIQPIGGGQDKYVPLPK